ncbi:c-type cytochrome [Neorhizobium galegae]|uniref:cytochrome-c peroxidase n=1 Tax=Neorhizobium galegae TaxID=399 RepID=UPI0006211907|nr:cytochrome c peroxidase [Neorhizobium galegae]MCQ1767265.1 c-type cytochrome [Neorhizobium galegae]MCQ1846791.1 c-type cytochrome [Neorhizobium galegae]CDZ42048.1 Cytochrome c551 peroxidase [Neorhizobium galegae bv. officinalis]
MRLSVLCIALFSAVSFQGATAGNLADFKRPLAIPFDKVTPYSLQLATLGKMLFFDPRLSGAKNMNCASCHNPSFGFEVPVKTPVGAANTHLSRQAPTILNVAWTTSLFWDGRSPTLEAQAAGPITAPAEMNGKLDQIVADLRAISDYDSWFKQIFPDKGATQETLLAAIATYERTVVSAWSPFDRWVDGDQAAVSDSAKRGFELFTGKANCSVCHTGWNFTDHKFHNTGLPTGDIGRAKVEPNNPKALYAFKTPSLRNTLYRGPYMHNGSLATMEDVIAHYESGGVESPSRSDHISPFFVTDREREDLIAFLKTLTPEQQDLLLPTLPN